MVLSLPEMLKNFPDDAGLGDEGNYPEPASAAVTNQRVDFVNASDEIGPPSSKGGLALRTQGGLLLIRASVGLGFALLRMT